MKSKNFPLVCVKIFITAAILFLIKQKVHLSEILQILEKVSISCVVIASLMIALSTLLTGFRWYYVLKSSNINIPIKHAIAQIYKGFSVSQIMPSNIGGDIYRILDIRKNVTRYTDATALVALDRILGMLSMLFCSIMMTPFFMKTITDASLGKFIALLLISALVLFLCLYCLNRFTTKKIPMLHQLIDFGTALLKFKKLPQVILITLSITLLYILPVSVLAQDIGIMVDAKVFLLVVPLVTLLSAIPISFAGWGVREGLMVFFLGIFGIQNEQALVLSVLFGSVNLISAAPGALMFFTSSNLSRQTA